MRVGVRGRVRVRLGLGLGLRRVGVRAKARARVRARTRVPPTRTHLAQELEELLLLGGRRPVVLGLGLVRARQGEVAVADVLEDGVEVLVPARHHVVTLGILALVGVVAW